MRTLWLARALYLVPPLFVVWVISDLEPVRPVLDQWSLVPLFENVAAGRATLADFFAPHGPHQHATSNFLWVALAFTTNWSLLAELYACIALAFLGLLALFSISLAPLRGRIPPSQHVANLLTGLLCFSLVQYQNFTWGFATIIFFVTTPYLAAVALLRPAETAGHENRRLAGAALLCLVSTMSGAPGLVSWPALLPSVWAVGRRRGRALIWTFAWVACAALAIGLYFIPEYVSDSSTGAFYRILQNNPGRVFGYFFSLIGMPLGYAMKLSGPFAGTNVAPIAAGTFLTLSFLLLVGHFALRAEIWKAPAGSVRFDFVPWFCVGLYSLLYAALNTLGRVGDTAHWGILADNYYSMYTGQAGLTAVAVVQLVALSYRDARIENRRAAAWKAVALVGAALVIASVGWSDWKVERRIARTAAKQRTDRHCLPLRHYLEEGNTCRLSREAASWADLEILEGLGFRPALHDLSFDEAPSPAPGSLDAEVTFSEIAPKVERVELTGWLRCPDGPPPDATVLLSRGASQQLFAHTRPDWSACTGSEPTRETGASWQMRFLASRLRGEAQDARAWLYRADEPRLVALDGLAALPARQSQPGAEPSPETGRLQRFFRKAAERRRREQLDR